ncbi:hypothetical protein [Hyphomicrobium sp. CS1BSMeth3]|uniref:hypothetical protein n=1 Tax=Hyphomicrobium sp. CS1BSMeth3 TaxID=1892844 RepID=UPI0009316BA0|nr:hypothetical protein [Hyphomicrobium sp. CS1BSMeth3]
MSDLHKALADIGNIRLQLAAGTTFRGFGPTVIAATGLLSIAAAAAQSMQLLPHQDPVSFLSVWIAVAAVSAVLIGVEMRARTRRQHSGLADAMLVSAVEHFLPVGAAGAVIAAVLMRLADDALWLLPGLWQMLIALGLFAAVRFLPRTIIIAAAWYFVTGATVLALASETRTLSPWSMGLPFGIGQLVLAIILRVAEGGDDVEIR